MGYYHNCFSQWHIMQLLQLLLETKVMKEIQRLVNQPKTAGLITAEYLQAKPKHCFPLMLSSHVQSEWP